MNDLHHVHLLVAVFFAAAFASQTTRTLGGNPSCLLRHFGEHCDAEPNGLQQHTALCKAMLPKHPSLYADSGFLAYHDSFLVRIFSLRLEGDIEPGNLS
jgi:hypothetical protein